MRTLVLTPKFKRSFNTFVKRNTKLQQQIEETLTIVGLFSQSNKTKLQKLKRSCCLILEHTMKCTVYPTRNGLFHVFLKVIGVADLRYEHKNFRTIFRCLERSLHPLNQQRLSSTPHSMNRTLLSRLSQKRPEKQ